MYNKRIHVGASTLGSLAFIVCTDMLEGIMADLAWFPALFIVISWPFNS